MVVEEWVAGVGRGGCEMGGEVEVRWGVWVKSGRVMVCVWGGGF